MKERKKEKKGEIKKEIDKEREKERERKRERERYRLKEKGVKIKWGKKVKKAKRKENLAQLLCR